jgi:tRNA (cmo5U34)-methyltransferase
VKAESDPHGVHDWHSREYVDSWITNDVTRDSQRRPVLRRLAELLPVERDESALILDIGGGYGMLTREVLEELPSSRVVLQDLSEAMMDQARERLGPLASRVTFVQADLRDPTWISAVGGPFRSVVSSIAIHNVRDPAVIRTIYAQVLGVLEPGGSFFNLDFVAPEIDATLAPGVPRSNSATATDQLVWLQEAGFEDVKVELRYENQALLVGKRAGQPAEPADPR